MLKKAVSVITSFAVLAMTFAMPLNASAASGDNWANFAASGYAGGDGSDGNPYRISTAGQLAFLAKEVNSGTNYYGQSFLLTADLDLSAYQWTPIGASTDFYFMGNFDGGGHTVSGLTIGTSSNPAAFNRAGLFGLYDYGSLTNLTLENASVYSTSPCSAAGSLVGICEGMLKNCRASGQVTGLGVSTGGLVGMLYSTMDGCRSSVSVSGDKNRVGGIVGINYGTVQNCSVTGSVSGGINNSDNSEQANSVGGIAGRNENTIANCYFTGAISLKGSANYYFNYVGGIAGENSQSLSGSSVGIFNCYSAAGSVAVSPLACYGGIVCFQNNSTESGNFWRSDTSSGTVNFSNSYNHSTPASDGIRISEEMKQTSFASAMNINVSGNYEWARWVADSGNVNGGYPVLSPLNDDTGLGALSVDGISLTPSFSADTQNYTATVDKPVFQTTVTPVVHCGLSSVTVNGKSLLNGSATVDLNPGLNMIEIKVTAQDGTARLYTIKVTKLVSSDATLKSLTINSGELSPAFDPGTYNYNVTLPWDSGTFYFTPTVSNTGAQMTVDGDPCDSGYQTGTIYLNEGESRTFEIVVTAQDNVTKNTYKLTVTKSERELPILSSLSCSAGTLSPTFDPDHSRYTLTMPTSASSVTLTPVPSFAHSTVQVNGNDLINGSAAVALTPGTAQDINISVKTSDDWTRSYSLHVTWLRPNWQDSGFVASGFGGGTGSSSDPYLISNAGQLARLAQQVNSGKTFSGTFFRMTGDIDLSTRDWTPIGTEDNGFCGTFDGAGHHITGLTIGTNTDPAPTSGLFFVIDAADSETLPGTVKNLSVDVKEFVNTAAAGLAVNSRGIIDNCSVSGTVTCVMQNRNPITSNAVGVRSNSIAGGIVGTNLGEISGCHSTCNLSGADEVSGIACRNGGKISNCYSTGSLSSETAAGGIVCDNQGQISDCYSTGNLSAESRAGGIVCDNRGPVSSCYSTGNLSAKRIVGGIAAGNVGISPTSNNIRPQSNGSIINCYSRGTLTGGNECAIGGIVGENGASVSNCYSAASLTGGDPSDGEDDSNIGGIAGYNSGNIANCYTTGSLSGTATSSIGGIAGLNEGPSAITSSYWSLDAVQKSGDTPRPANLMKGVGEGTDSGTQGLSAAAMKSVASPTFVQTLNGGRTTADEALWKFLSGQNSGFPVLNGIGEGCSSDASLSSLQVGSGTLDPQFSKGRTAYAVAVSKDALSLTVTPTANDPWATVTINGQAATSGTPFTASLTPGANTDVKVVVTAQDKTTVTTYTVTAVRPAPAPTIVSVSVSPSSASVIQGRSQKFTAQVITTGNADKTVKWLVTGNNSTRTKIDSSGTLTVAADETAKSLTIKAISQFDQSRSATATAAVLPSKVDGDSAGISADLSNTTLPSGVTSVSLRITAVPQQDADNTVIGNLLKGSAFHSPFSQLLVYNVELLDQNGKPIEPTGGAVTVRIPVPAGMSGNLHVYWYNQTDKTLTDMNATVQNGYLVFTTTHFSEYAIVQLTGSSNGSPAPNPKTGSGSGTPFLPLVLIGTGSAAGFVVARRKIKCRFKRKTVD